MKFALLQLLDMPVIRTRESIADRLPFLWRESGLGWYHATPLGIINGLLKAGKTGWTLVAVIEDGLVRDAFWSRRLD